MRTAFLGSSFVLAALGPAVAAGDVIIPREQIPFALEAPDQPQELGKLWGNRATGPAGTLLKVPGGWVAPVHAHTAGYRGIVIEGVWKHWLPGQEDQALALKPGSYWTQKADQPHADACLSSSDCIVLLINEAPYKTYLPGP